MNERIRDLCITAGAAPLPGSTGLFINALDPVKFAELVIKECIGCIDIMEKIANSTNASIPKDYDKHTYLKTLDAMRGLIEVHFGVEE